MMKRYLNFLCEKSEKSYLVIRKKNMLTIFILEMKKMEECCQTHSKFSLNEQTFFKQLEYAISKEKCIFAL
jgi:hypothetical protein